MGVGDWFVDVASMHENSSFVPRPIVTLFFILWFAFTTIHRSRRAVKTGKPGRIHHMSVTSSGRRGGGAHPQENLNMVEWSCLQHPGSHATVKSQTLPNEWWTHQGQTESTTGPTLLHPPCVHLTSFMRWILLGLPHFHHLPLLCIIVQTSNTSSSVISSLRFWNEKWGWPGNEAMKLTPWEKLSMALSASFSYQGIA